MSEENPRRLYVYAIVDEETHTQMLQAASKKGLHISDLTKEYVLEGLGKEEDDSDPELAFYKKVNVNRKRERIFNQMRSQVYNALQKSDNDELDQLEIHCQKMGISYEAVLDSAQDSDIKPITFDNPIGVKAASAWLVDVMDKGQDYKAADLIKESEIKGFTRDTLNRAKRAVEIKAHRGSDGWYWKR